MSIKILPSSGLCFSDVNDVFRLIRGVPLSRRTEFRRLHAQAYSRYDQWLQTEEPWDSLWSQQPFRHAIAQLLDFANLQNNWVINEDLNLIPRLLLLYPKDGQLYLGDWVSWEFPPAQAIAKGESKPKESEAFSSLLITDINETLIELHPLPASAYYRFIDLIDALYPLLSNGFHHAYDTSAIARRFTNEALELFGLSPDQISASLAIELLFSDWEKREGGRVYLPGWLHQLCSPPANIKPRGEPLPQDEDPHHALIASMWRENGLEDAIRSANAVPYPTLLSILHSRNRMLENYKSNREDGPKKGKENRFGMKLSQQEKEKFDSIDFDALRDEFFSNMILPTSIPAGAIGSSQIAQN